MPKEPLDGSTAKKVIRAALADGRTNISGHFKKRLKDRDITMQDAVTVLKKGVGVRTEMDIQTGYWKYTVTGSGIDQNPVTVVVNIFLEENKIRLITVFSDEK